MDERSHLHRTCHRHGYRNALRATVTTLTLCFSYYYMPYLCSALMLSTSPQPLPRGVALYALVDAAVLALYLLLSTINGGTLATSWRQRRAYRVRAGIHCRSRGAQALLPPHVTLLLFVRRNPAPVNRHRLP